MTLAAFEGRNDLHYWLRFGGDATLDSYGRAATLNDIPWSHRNFIRQCRLWHETDDFLFVHANYAPSAPLDRQSSTRLLWEHLDPKTAAPHCSGKTAVVGHTPQANGLILDLGFLVCIDTGCCDGGWLTALDVRSGKIWQANQEGQTREFVRGEANYEQVNYDC
jgi:serine/threonine protein phosphatase 1